MSAKIRALLAKWWPIPVAALVAGLAYVAGRYAKPAETKTETKTESTATILYASHGESTTADRGVTQTRKVKVEQKKPDGSALTTTTTDTLHAADLTLHSNWTGSIESESASSAAATTTTTASRPGWSVGVGALWDPGHLSLKPQTYTLEVDRRLFGSLWVGVRANTDKQVGASVRAEW